MEEKSDPLLINVSAPFSLILSFLERKESY